MSDRNPRTALILIVVSVVSAICLILKIWIIRRVLGLHEDFVELLIPTLMPAIQQIVSQIIWNRGIDYLKKWDTPFTWSILVVVITALSMLNYLR